MGRNAWYNLPEEVVEMVFAYLPISEVFKLRLVCKQWKSILTSKSFMELWTNLSPPNPWFLVYHSSDVLSAYDPCYSTWTNMPVYERCVLDSRQVLLMASAGGLLCFRNRNAEYPTLIVCNPLTKTHKVLPEMLHIRYIDIVGMVADKTTNSYKILVTGTSESSTDESITEVYDSRLGRWIYHCNSKQEFLQFWYEVHAIWLEGFFYCLAMPVTAAQGYRLLRYNMEARKWDDLDVKMPSHDIRCPSLLICRGRLLLAAKIVEDYSIRSICIWELKMDCLQWVRIDVMPGEVLSKIHLPYFLILQCQGLMPDFERLDETTLLECLMNLAWLQQFRLSSLNIWNFNGHTLTSSKRAKAEFIVN
ncbi:hypothetical protein SUGI_1148100 [Cryptomeria japonica]|nr:hypothetical protein SUGI_1148100 [Cryptomeria japonica]